MDWKKREKPKRSWALPVLLAVGVSLVALGITLHFTNFLALQRFYVARLIHNIARGLSEPPAPPPNPPSPPVVIAPLKLAPIPESYTTPAPLQVDGWVMREAYKKQVAQRLAAEDFAWLEQEAERLRHGELWPGGTWKLPEFYEGIVASEPARDSEKFPHIAERWKTQFPASQTPLVALGKWWTEQAWRARGGRWASEVPKSAWKPFEDCLRQARETLETIPRQDVRDPSWYATMMVVSLGQGWDKEEQERLFANAITLAPTDIELYTRHAYYLLPRWYGSPGEWEKFARKISATRHDPSLYTRIVWSADNYGENLAPVDWERFKQGGYDLIKQWPNSGWNIANLCGLIYQHGDYATLAQWGQLLGAVAIPNASVTPGVLRYAAMLADHPGYRPPAPLFTIPTDGSDCYAVALLPSGQVAYGTRSGFVYMQDPSGSDAPEIIDFHGKSVSKLAVSPDGKLLAAAQGILDQTMPGFAVVYDLEQKKQIARIDGWTGTAEFPAFTPDGKFLYIAGGSFQHGAQLKRWNRETGKVEDLDWASDLKVPLCTITFSPDGKIAAADWLQNIRAWDTSSGRRLLDAPPIQGIADCVWCVRFLPDGKTIVAANSPAYVDRGDSTGGLLWWDAQTFQPLPPHPDDRVSGADRMIVSPDGTRIYNNDQDGMLYVRDAQTRKLLNFFPSAQEYVLDIAISPDGQRLATAGRNGTVKIWDTAQLEPPSH